MQPGDLITRCPHCNTTFRITENQLEVAGGAVRCGSCLEIFAARNHLIEVGSPTESGTATLTLDDDQDLADHHEEGDLSADVNDPEDVIDSEADDPFFHEEDAYADDDTSRDALFSDDESDLDLDDVSFATQSDEIRTLDEISVLNLDTDHDEPDESDPNKRAELDDMRGFASEEDTEGDNVEDHEKFDEAQSDVGSPGEAATDDSSITDLEVEQDMSRDSLEPLEDESGQRQLFAADNADVQATKTPTESSLMPEADEPDWPQPDDEDPFDEPSDANDGLPEECDELLDYVDYVRKDCKPYKALYAAISKLRKMLDDHGTR
ncbi:MAG: MJ0042-type zinc finger domain-containing protein, partial [Pseudomonadota bacterium]